MGGGRSSRRLLASGAALLAALALALPAHASPLDAAKTAGQAGEQSDGYLGVPPGAPASARALVDKVNADRAAHYRTIAQKNGTSPAAVAALAGRKLVERTPPGQWVRDAEGNWRRR